MLPKMEVPMDDDEEERRVSDWFQDASRSSKQHDLFDQLVAAREERF